MFPLVARWNHGPSYVGLPDELEDFEWMTYADPEIISYIPPEVLDNQEMWDANVPLIMIESVPSREPFFSIDTTTADDYLTWFRTVGKSYLLPPEAMSRQIWSKRQCRPPQQRRRGRDCITGTDVPRMLYFYANVSAKPHIGTDVDLCTPTNDDNDVDAHAIVSANVYARYLFNIHEIWGILWLHAYIDPNTARITILPRQLIIATTGHRSGGYIMAGEDDVAINHGGR
ncbi:hypothetical protein J1N35_014291 [Gossypium stocksii]|uniref:Uncharacterized protein n=1 Tax=Gossypium stocksii TaxID=47602 RepID=A0A9D4A8R1_9ROSI|nr:hypothetical protein J1N35_014291 [Gossypium stocksii]